MARVIQVIETEDKRGKGTEGDPIRGVMQYWTLEGALLAECDPEQRWPAAVVVEAGSGGKWRDRS